MNSNSNNQNLLVTIEKQELLKNLSGERFKNHINYEENDITDYFTTNKYKVAICLSGHVRDYNKNLESINKFLIKPLNADVFMHTWDSVGKQVVVTKDVVGPVPNENNKNLPNFHNILLNLKSLEIENNLQYLSTIEDLLKNKTFFLYGMSLGDNYFGGQAEPKYIYSQFYSIYRSFKLLENYSKENKIDYDIVIKLRSDYNLSSGIFVEDFEIIKNSNNKIFVPDLPYSNHGHPMCSLCKENVEHYEHVEDTCDVFAYSDYNVMAHYMTVYENLENIRKYQVLKNEQKMLNFKFSNLETKDSNVLVDIWKPLNYNLDCFYPERIFNKHLEKYIFCSSKMVGKVIR